MSLPKIFVAMDFTHQEHALSLARKLSPKHCGLKIGKELFTSHGPKLVDSFFNMGYSIFLDLKFHDIPNTVAKACQAAAKLGVSMLNVHILGGEAMLNAAREALESFSKRPKLLGVTLLTSLDDKDLKQLNFSTSKNKLVQNLAQLAHQCQLDGLVCSPRECAALKQQFGQDLLLVTPGIRTNQTKGSDDQKRIATPQSAIALGSDILVIGRPITQAADPRFALHAILDDIGVTETL